MTNDKEKFNQRASDRLMHKIKTGAKKTVRMIDAPYIVMFPIEGGKVVCSMHPPKDGGVLFYAMLINDLINHIADTYDVPPLVVRQAVEMDRQIRPGSDVVETFSTVPKR